MDKKMASDINQYITLKAHDALVAFVEMEILKTKTKLESCSVDDLKNLQGRIAALKEVLQIRKYAIDVLDN